MYTLPNGLRILCAPSVTDVVYCGIAVAAGTRHELENESGMAHFVEHMTFKGTSRRSAMQVINHMESVGGDLNAFTGKEETVYYSVFLRQHLSRAIPLLMDIVFGSTYPEDELSREAEVVIDEIESYEDSPSELIFDEFDTLLFPEHPLGRNILGQAERLRQYRSDDLRSFARRLYHPSRAVLFVVGNVDPSHVLQLATRASAPICHSSEPIRHSSFVTRHSSSDPICHSPFVIRERGTHQAHVIIGARAYAATDPRHMGLSLLSNLLGGPCMNSRLNIALRERRGLVYTVESNLASYTDTGSWSVYFGCDASDVQRCLRLVRSELRRLTDKPLSERTLAAAKRQLKGQIGVSYDNFENVAIGMAKRYLHYGEVLTPEQLYARIDVLTAQDLQAIAADVFAADRLQTLVYR